MRQTKMESFVEACINTFTGFVITMIFYPLINYLCGIHLSIGQMSLSTALFTALSIVRGYAIRRFFEGNIAKYIFKRLKI